MADVDFFWDPMCPWAWNASRWVVEVADELSLDVDWRFISLHMINDEAGYEDKPEGYEQVHQLGLNLLRVAAAVRSGPGRDHLGPLYTAMGTRIHVEGDRDGLSQASEIAALLEKLGLPDDLAAAAEDASFDAEIATDTELALERAGKGLGTPVITFGPPDGPSFFGPVISRVPKGKEAVALWKAIDHIGRFPGFAELKRGLREKPQVDSHLN